MPQLKYFNIGSSTLGYVQSLDRYIEFETEDEYVAYVREDEQDEDRGC